LIWTRSSNTIRARGMNMAATEAGHMSAPDDAPEPAPKNPSCAWGGYTCCTNQVMGEVAPFPGQTYPTASVTGMPSAV